MSPLGGFADPLLVELAPTPEPRSPGPERRGHSRMTMSRPAANPHSDGNS